MNVKSFKYLGQLLKQYYAKYLWLALICGSLSSFGTIFLSYLTGEIINQIVAVHGQMQLILPTLSLFLCTLIITVITLWLTQRLTYQIAYLLIEKLRFMSLTKINELNLATLEQFGHGDLLSRLTNDTENIANALYQIGNTLFIGLTTIICATFMMLTMSFPLTLVVFCTTPLIFYFMSIVSRKSHHFTQAQQAILGDMTNFLNEYLPQKQLINNFQQVNNLNNRFQQKNQHLYEIGQKAQFIASLTNPLSRFVDHLTYALIGLIGGLLFFYAHKNAMIGVIASFTLYASQFAKPFIELAGLTNQIQIAQVGLERLAEIRHLPTEQQISTKTVRLNPQTEPLINFDHVAFGYTENRLIFQDLNFTLNNKQTLAIVGPTGVGKSTIINLIMRFAKPTKGTITLHDQNIQAIPLTQYYDLFGLVLQDTWLYEDTIYNNLCFGATNISNERFQEACQKMYLTNIINRLPKKEHTILSEANLSNGEKQLLTIARAYLKDPQILVLDEATSSLDVMTEQLVKEALQTLTKNRTSIIIAHHLSTIKHADKIIVLKDGKIIEQGTHQQLMNDQTSFYYDLYTNQYDN